VSGATKKSRICRNQSVLPPSASRHPVQASPSTEGKEGLDGQERTEVHTPAAGRASNQSVVACPQISRCWRYHHKSLQPAAQRVVDRRPASDREIQVSGSVVPQHVTHLRNQWCNSRQESDDWDRRLPGFTTPVTIWFTIVREVITRHDASYQQNEQQAYLYQHGPTSICM
jgi:hypothetical protein